MSILLLKLVQILLLIQFFVLLWLLIIYILFQFAVWFFRILLYIYFSTCLHMSFLPCCSSTLWFIFYYLEITLIISFALPLPLSSLGITVLVSILVTSSVPPLFLPVFILNFRFLNCHWLLAMGAWFPQSFCCCPLVAPPSSLSGYTLYIIILISFLLPIFSIFFWFTGILDLFSICT